MNIENRVGDVILSAIEEMGYRLVKVNIINTKNLTLQVMVERKDREQITLKHCSQISREVSGILESEKIFKSRFNLEVSSPGIDRPLVCMTDYERYCGYDAKIETHKEISGKKNFTGKILGVNEQSVRIGNNELVFDLPLSEIKAAKLILTEQLIAAKNLLGG
ncbi:MAG: ribosome maturation factor RimP [Pseudomonadota bacterium]|nr:ribosome maturation factor RimP [Pseudomonadota bacterium]